MATIKDPDLLQRLSKYTEWKDSLKWMSFKQPASTQAPATMADEMSMEESVIETPDTYLEKTMPVFSTRDADQKLSFLWGLLWWIVATQETQDATNTPII